MTNVIGRRADLYRANIRRALREVWDPMGICDIPELETEYDVFIPRLHELLISRRPTLEVVQYLWSAETEDLKLGGNWRACEKAAERLAGVPGEVEQAIGSGADADRISVAGVVPSDGTVVVLRDDPFCPLRVRTYPDLLGGARYVYLGLPGQILELILPANSMVVRGVSVVQIHQEAASPLVGSGPEWRGLPALRLPSATAFPDREIMPSLRVGSSFAAYLGTDWVEVQLAGFASFDASTRHGNLSFLFCGELVAGIRVDGLLKTDIDHFAGRFAQ